MLRSETLFGKREPSAPNSPFSSNGAHPQAPGNPSPQRAPSPQSSPATGSGHSVTPLQPHQNAPQAAQPQANSNAGSKLIVGPNIKLKGVEITDCDTLVVEGRVEATMDSRVIQIAEHGAFKGSAEIDIAEIHGEFDGELTVREKLVIYATGKVSGKIRYGKLVVEEGGQLSGDIQVQAVVAPVSTATAAASAPRNLSVAKTV